MLISITACKKEIEKNIPNLNPISDCYLKDGRLIFKDYETFKENLNWITANQTNPDLIIQRYETIGLISMMTIYNKGMDLVDNVKVFHQYVSEHPTAFHEVNFDKSIIYELPTATVLAYLSNENGIYQVGDKVFRNTFDYCLELSTENIGKIDKLLMPISKLNDSDIKVISNNPNGLKSGGDYGDYGEYSYLTDYIQSDIRIVARLKTFYYGGGTCFEARTTAQKRNFLGIWFQKTINELRLSWAQGQVKYYAYTYPYIVYAHSYIRTNESDITGIVFNAYSPIDLSQSSCLASHYGEHNTTASITNNEIFR